MINLFKKGDKVKLNLETLPYYFNIRYNIKKDDIFLIYAVDPDDDTIFLRINGNLEWVSIEYVILDPQTLYKPRIKTFENYILEKKEETNYDDYLSQIEDKNYYELTDHIWELIKNNDIDDKFNDNNKDDWKYTKLNISDVDSFSITIYDDTIINKWIKFKWWLNNNLKNTTLIIDNELGKIYILKLHKINENLILESDIEYNINDIVTFKNDENIEEDGIIWDIESNDYYVICYNNIKKTISRKSIIQINNTLKVGKKYIILPTVETKNYLKFFDSSIFDSKHELIKIDYNHDYPLYFSINNYKKSFRFDEIKYKKITALELYKPRKKEDYLNENLQLSDLEVGDIIYFEYNDNNNQYGIITKLKNDYFEININSNMYTSKNFINFKIIKKYNNLKQGNYIKILNISSVLSFFRIVQVNDFDFDKQYKIDYVSLYSEYPVSIIHDGKVLAFTLKEIELVEVIIPSQLYKPRKKQDYLNEKLDLGSLKNDDVLYMNYPDENLYYIYNNGYIINDYGRKIKLTKIRIGMLDIIKKYTLPKVGNSIKIIKTNDNIKYLEEYGFENFDFDRKYLIDEIIITIHKPIIIDIEGVYIRLGLEQIDLQEYLYPEYLYSKRKKQDYLTEKIDINKLQNDEIIYFKYIDKYGEIHNEYGFKYNNDFIIGGQDFNLNKVFIKLVNDITILKKYKFPKLGEY